MSTKISAIGPILGLLIGGVICFVVFTNIFNVFVFFPIFPFGLILIIGIGAAVAARARQQQFTNQPYRARENVSYRYVDNQDSYSENNPYLIQKDEVRNQEITGTKKTEKAPEFSRYCQYCGIKIDENGNFCHGCGTQLNS